MKINYVVGDATEPRGDGNKIICHICNTVGAWGAGFVLALSNKWKEPEEKYLQDHKDGKSLLGVVNYTKVEDDIVVANMIAQEGVNYPDRKDSPIRYEALKTALAWVNEFAIHNQATLHMPRIGCGLAGGQWSEVEKILIEVVTVNVTVYDF